MAISGHQWSSVEISGNQVSPARVRQRDEHARRLAHLPSCAISRTQIHSEGNPTAIINPNHHQRTTPLRDQRSSEVIRGHQRSSEVIRGYQRSSEVLRGPQRSSEVISRASASSRT